MFARCDVDNGGCGEGTCTDNEYGGGVTCGPAPEADEAACNDGFLRHKLKLYF